MMMNGVEEELLSKRAQTALTIPSVLVKYSSLVSSDPFHLEKNPKGFVDLGTAENRLMEDIIIPKLERIRDIKTDTKTLYYTNLKGLPSFRNQVKYFYEDRFHPTYEINPQQFQLTCGTTAALETLAFAIAEHGDSILISSPFYYRILNDFKERAGVECFPVPLYSKDSEGNEFQLSAEKLEEAYHRATAHGHNVKGLVLINPHNPLGDVYSPEQLMECLLFADKYNLHVILDEIYAFSVFDESTTFASGMSLQLPNPMKTHFIWGFSKDLGISGYRCGILHSQNPDILRYAEAMAMYQEPSVLVQWTLENLIRDTAWLDEVYFPTYHQRLRKSFQYTNKRLNKMGVDVHPSKAGIFVWADMSKFLSSPTFEAEQDLQSRFIDWKVYILGGESSFSAEPGWFRIVVSTSREQLQTGLDRIERALHEIRNRPAGAYL